MRDTKYRAWDKVNKVMIGCDSLDFENRIIWPSTKEPERYKIENGEIFEKVWEYEPGLVGYAFERVEIMQFTGMPDINKTDIYEFDLLKDWRGNNHLVTFTDGSFWIENDGGTLLMSKTNISRLEMIVSGNKFENPELLEVT